MKKKKLLLVVMVALMLLTFSMPVVSAVKIKGCDALIEDVIIDVKIANAVHTVITIIKIAVPVLLVIFGMIDLFKGIMAQKEDEIKKGQSIFVKRIIAAVLVFFVISIVQFVVSLVADDKNGNIMNCANCFLNGANSTSGECNK